MFVCMFVLIRDAPCRTIRISGSDPVIFYNIVLLCTESVIGMLRSAVELREVYDNDDDDDDDDDD